MLKTEAAQALRGPFATLSQEIRELQAIPRSCSLGVEAQMVAAIVKNVETYIADIEAAEKTL